MFDGDQREEFVLFDWNIGYRLPKRLGTLNVGVRNILDESFDFQGLGDRTFRGSQQAPQTAQLQTDALGAQSIIPERTKFGNINLVF